MTHGRPTKKRFPVTEAERRAWIRKKQAAAELRNIKRRMKLGNQKPTDENRTKELELLI